MNKTEPSNHLNAYTYTKGSPNLFLHKTCVQNEVALKWILFDFHHSDNFIIFYFKENVRMSWKSFLFSTLWLTFFSPYKSHSVFNHIVQFKPVQNTNFFLTINYQLLRTLKIIQKKNKITSHRLTVIVRSNFLLKKKITANKVWHCKAKNHFRDFAGFKWNWKNISLFDDLHQMKRMKNSIKLWIII